MTLENNGSAASRMQIAKATASLDYLRWLRKIVDTHRCQGWNAPLSECDEREEEELADLWPQLEDSLKQRVWGLSADLGTLVDKEVWVETDWPPMTKQELARALHEAFEQKNWDNLLELLRRPPRFYPQEMVDYLRGRAWTELGHPDVALLFFDNAARLASGNATYLVLALECVKDLQDFPELLKRCESYVQDPVAPARLLFRAGDGFHLYARLAGESKYFELAIAAIDLGFQRLKDSGQPKEQPSVVAAAYATKSFCLEQLQRFDDSLDVLNEAVNRFPTNTSLLTARGLLKRELGKTDATDDFRLAARHGPIIAWGYAELARSAVQDGDNEQALDFCQKGIGAAREPTAVAFLLQLEAIARFRLQKSGDEARTAFQHALRLDPLSEEARINSERLESFLADPVGGEPRWEFIAAPTTTMREDLLAAFSAPHGMAAAA